MICGQIEVEGDKEIFRSVQMDVAELQTELRVVSFFFLPDKPSWFIRDWFHNGLMMTGYYGTFSEKA